MEDGQAPRISKYLPGLRPHFGCRASRMASPPILSSSTGTRNGSGVNQRAACTALLIYPSSRSKANSGVGVCSCFPMQTLAMLELKMDVLEQRFAWARFFGRVDNLLGLARC